MFTQPKCRAIGLIACLCLLSVSLNGCGIFARQPNHITLPLPEDGVVLMSSAAIDRMTSVPRVVANDGPIELVGFSLTPEERAEFDRARAARIDAKLQAGARPTSPPRQSPEPGPALLLLPLFLPYIALQVAAAPLVPVVEGTESGSKRIIANLREPNSPITISKRDAEQLTSALQARSPSAALAQRITERAINVDAPRAAISDGARLEVAIKAFKVDYRRKQLAVLTMLIDVNAFDSAGKPTNAALEHRTVISKVKLTANNGQDAKQTVEDAYEEIATWIADVYFPAPRAPITE